MELLLSQTITLRGTAGRYGAICDGNIGIFTNSSNYGCYCYTYFYDKSENTLMSNAQIPTGRNWYWGNAFAYKLNNNYHIVGTFNNSGRGPTTVNLDTGAINVNELSPRNDMLFFTDEYTDSSNPFLAISGTRSSDGGSQNYFIKKLHATYGISSSSGAQISNGFSNSAAGFLHPVKYFDSPSKILVDGTLSNQEMLMNVSDDFTTITPSYKTFPASVHMQYLFLHTNGVGYYQDSSYDYVKFNISEYLL